MGQPEDTVGVQGDGDEGRGGDEGHVDRVEHRAVQWQCGETVPGEHQLECRDRAVGCGACGVSTVFHGKGRSLAARRAHGSLRHGSCYFDGFEGFRGDDEFGEARDVGGRWGGRGRGANVVEVEGGEGAGLVAEGSGHVGGVCCGVVVRDSGGAEALVCGASEHEEYGIDGSQACITL